MSWRDVEPVVRFFCPGVPAPGGSKKAVRAGGKPDGKVLLVDDAKNNGKWRDRVAHFARKKYGAAPLLAGPLGLSLLFVMTRPKGHFGTGRNAHRLKPSAPEYPAVKPDPTKLTRSTEDALTGVLWVDDAQIVRQEVWKQYGAAPGVLVEIRILETPDRSQGH